ncbi:MAG: isoprenylcysteine carboxylmethyltransferase family protein, partial [Alphaproteobacteria bacterium]|nr:isoprenylcysteine carboxylmethyltransferase family protein [Alphaproteobacteria bacterium]
WSSLYIAGRKKLELVQDGPYSISRNPLYLFSIIGAAGVGGATGSLTGMALAAILCASIFSIVIIKEEGFLRKRFGQAFEDYARRTPCLLQRLSSLQISSETVINPQLIMRNFRDSALFLLAIPLIEGIEELQELGWLPVYFVFP